MRRTRCGLRIRMQRMLPKSAAILSLHLFGHWSHFPRTSLGVWNYRFVLAGPIRVRSAINRLDWTLPTINFVWGEEAWKDGQSIYMDTSPHLFFLLEIVLFTVETRSTMNQNWWRMWQRPTDEPAKIIRSSNGFGKKFITRPDPTLPANIYRSFRVMNM